MKKDAINPKTLFTPQGFSHGIAITGDHKTIYVGGQNAVNQNEEVVGVGDIGKQTKQVLENIEAVLQESDASLGDIIKMTVYIVQGQNPLDGFKIFQEKRENIKTLPTISTIYVCGLAHPDWLIEIDAVAIK